MKKYTLFILVFLCLNTIGQVKDKCDFKQVAARLGKLNAASRKSVFKTSKYKALKDANERLEIPFTVSSFFKLLEFTNDTQSNGDAKYDGLRIYFAVNPKQTDEDFDKLNLIFVPTINKIDDIDSCWIIKLNSDLPVRITSSEASDWIRKFQNDKYLKFDSDGKNRSGSHFQETKSLWYDAKYLGNSSGGLLYFFNCKKNKLKTVAIKFGGFGGFSKYNYHLTLIFNFSFDKGEGTDITFTVPTTANLKESFNKINFKITGSGGTNTGVPCPPYPTNSTSCPGALLPQ